jgi:hypothetical protein
LDLRTITNELGSVIDKWFQIGIQLGLSEFKLRQIRADCHTVHMCFTEVISFWLNGNTKVAVSWESLVEVLESSFVDEKGLASSLREKGETIVSETVGVPGATESGGQPQEITGGQRGKQSSAEEKLDDSDDQQRERQGT